MPSIWKPIPLDDANHKTPKIEKKIKKKKLPNQEDGERRLRVQAKTGKGGLIDEAAEPAAQGDAQAEG